jgi:hypothetical protein
MNARTQGARRVIPGSPFNRPEAEQEPAQVFEVGDQVCHDRHGLGRVLQVGDGRDVVADFGTSVRRIALPCSKLTKL